MAREHQSAERLRMRNGRNDALALLTAVQAVALRDRRRRRASEKERASYFSSLPALNVRESRDHALAHRLAVNKGNNRVRLGPERHAAPQV
jgi:hypothetical protein